MSDLDSRAERSAKRWTIASRVIEIAFVVLFGVLLIAGFATRNPWWFATGMFGMLSGYLKDIHHELRKLNQRRDA